jgi:hypothetical protein
MANTIRPVDAPTATAPATGDVVLIDGPNGTRALPASYFAGTFAPISVSKPLVAGPGISLVTDPNTGVITISAI